MRIFVLVFLIGLSLPWSYVAAESILSPHLYAWSNNSGYINFNNVTVDDQALGGYAWSANHGWINLNPSQGGVMNDGAGHLSGFAWGERLGWIDFDGVTIDVNGKFSGTATGTLIGTLTFDCPNFCDVQTDWRPNTQTVSASADAGQGGGGLISSPAVDAGDELSASPVSKDNDALQLTHLKSADILQDGVVNILDFNALIVAWEASANGNRADINGDGAVNVLDFNELMVYWGRTYTL